MRWLDSITNSVHMNLSKTPGDGRGQRTRRAAVHGLKRVGRHLAIEQQQQHKNKRKEIVS